MVRTQRSERRSRYTWKLSRMGIRSGMLYLYPEEAPRYAAPPPRRIAATPWAGMRACQATPWLRPYPRGSGASKCELSLRTISLLRMAKLDIVQRDAPDECHEDFRAAEPVIEAQGEDDVIAPVSRMWGRRLMGSGISPTWAQCSRRLQRNLRR